MGLKNRQTKSNTPIYRARLNPGFTSHNFESSLWSCLVSCEVSSRGPIRLQKKNLRNHPNYKNEMWSYLLLLSGVSGSTDCHAHPASVIYAHTQGCKQAIQITLLENWVTACEWGFSYGQLTQRYTRLVLVCNAVRLEGRVELVT